MDKKSVKYTIASCCSEDKIKKLKEINVSDFGHNDAEKLTALVFDQSPNEKHFQCRLEIVQDQIDQLTPKSSAIHIDKLLHLLRILKSALSSSFDGSKDIPAQADPRIYEPIIKESIIQVLTKIPYKKDTNRSLAYSTNYFYDAIKYKIDVRKNIPGPTVKDWPWNFETEKIVAGYTHETWLYALYLSTFGDDEAIQAIRKKLKSVTSGDRLAYLLKDLADLATGPLFEPELFKNKVQALIAEFRNDPRVLSENHFLPTHEYSTTKTVGARAEELLKLWGTANVIHER